MGRVERATREVLPRAGDVAWLMLQSLYTHRERLAMLPVLGAATRVLDVGAGTGALSLDLAWLLGDAARITAVDCDEASLELLDGMAARLGVRVRGVPGSAYALPVESDSQDLTVARFLFQHLHRPYDALKEMVRVTAPGGRVAVVAVDDGAGGAEPPVAPALRRLFDAIAELQVRRGGNRRVGRQLYRMMREAGLTELQVLAVPRVRLGTYHGRNDEMEDYQRRYLQGYKDALLDEGLLSEDGFAEAMAALDRSFAEDRFEYQAEFLAVGQVAAQSRAALGATG
ncbi:MAG: methyltransferase domain-containing protein [Gammaproteobacteria bacterium]